MDNSGLKYSLNKENYSKDELDSISDVNSSSEKSQIIKYLKKSQEENIKLSSEKDLKKVITFLNDFDKNRR